LVLYSKIFNGFILNFIFTTNRELARRKIMRKISMFLKVFVITASFLILSLQYSYSSESEKQVREAAGQFYSALDSMFEGDLAPMIAVWSHAKDVTYLGPNGGILIGWEQVKKSWEEQANLKLGGRVDPEEMHVTAGETLGIAVNFERGTSYINGKPEKVNIRATNIFRLENGKWKMIGHHTDILPWLESVQMEK
jgi:ketosteroid isomerase-like protein